MSDVLVTITCGGCGINYAIPDSLLHDRKKTGKTFTCPNGCIRHFIVEATAEQREIARLKAERGDANRLLSAERQSYDQLLREARRCPLCLTSVTTARSADTIRLRLARHLQEEHAAKRRMLAIPERTGAAK